MHRNMTGTKRKTASAAVLLSHNEDSDQAAMAALLGSIWNPSCQLATIGTIGITVISIGRDERHQLSKNMPIVNWYQLLNLVGDCTRR
jgi:hypothetical protein